MKKRDISLDYIRVVSMFFIVLFHAAYAFNAKSIWFLAYRNSTYGNIGNALFFMLSGYLLKSIYPKVENLKTFYIKRWLAIFPAFYIAFIVVYLLNVIRQKDFFYLGYPFSLLFTLFGIDNYVNWFNIPNYALVGEWFTGVIVVLYLLYPLLIKLNNRAKWTVTSILTIIYVLNIVLEWYPVNSGISFITCLFIFWSGILLAGYKDVFRKWKWTPLVTGIISLVLFFVKIPYVEETFVNHLLCISLFITILCLFKSVDKSAKTSKAIMWLSGLTYYIYLTHHYIANVMGRRTDIFGSMPKPVVVLIYIAVVFVSSMVLKYVTEKIVSINKSK